MPSVSAMSGGSPARSRESGFMLDLLALAVCFGAPLPGLTGIATTIVDPGVTGYATFQSHNQKAVANRHGVFLTYVRSRDEAYMSQEWRLLRSSDGGRTFARVYAATHATNPPVIETDRRGNLYLGYVDFAGGNAYIMKFDSDRGYSSSPVATIPRGAAGKYAMLLDERRRCLYWFAHNGTFARVELDTGGVAVQSIMKDGPDAALQYPSLSLAPDGVLHAAWTTVRHGQYLYWDIHHALSPDGGDTWHAPGQDAAWNLPFVADQHGPAPRIILDDEYDRHT